MEETTLFDKRIAGEIRKINREKTENIKIIQDSDNKYTFYFLLMGLNERESSLDSEKFNILSGPNKR